ncbi:S-formylglutathione hydrolase [Halobacteriovorax sp. JY17]|uniref:S-formylglutathione hydrolase n=1 Tax=Halobacteriovorax sp. JY17 TaxID=2014617 RepID=UPI000C645246|nr:S-formylglutathione hydrolase [Halobacteriovorax sp. JY17]PIK15222.1 MAG: S-formylglutathione hydrolase [Halobacteriovorax sp. JY17]
MIIEQTKKNKTFNGETCYYKHKSVVTGTSMAFSTFEPRPKEEIENAIIWLSGLTCTEENFITKSGVQKLLAGTNTMVICPDTSPRGLELDKEHESYDFGSGASFYLNATTSGYKDHYKMYDYVSIELIEILKKNFNVKKISIMGHSMGGHGALVLALNEINLFSSVSAFSPIVNPSECSWGRKAFKGYLGEDSDEYSKYDATLLIKNKNLRSDKILIDQGLADEFLEKELLTDNFIQVCNDAGQELEVNYREGYDHSYFFISTFLEDHITHHLNILNQ